MPRESRAARVERTAEILRRLARMYPDARCSLDHRDPFELLVATILSAQCTDARVNEVTPALFARYADAAALAHAATQELEEVIRPTGFFRNKARSLLGMARALDADHGGEVPRDVDELTRLPGVGRKTANVVRGVVWGDADGVVVDTHVKRISHRLGLTRETDPVKIEADLMKLIPEGERVVFTHRVIDHGRAVCVARTPRCEICDLSDVCPSSRAA